MKIMSNPALATATLGGGCFWCLEAVFERVRGVVRVTSGYAGGHAPHPTYEEVCSETTGHAEVVQIAYDPKAVSFDDLLAVFFAIHDPTTPDRQGNDRGHRYRSIILYHDETQRERATAWLDRLARDNPWGAPPVTELAPYTVFWPAEEYHQGYFRKHPQQPYCQFVVLPKVQKLSTTFPPLVAR